MISLKENTNAKHYKMFTIYYYFLQNFQQYHKFLVNCKNIELFYKTIRFLVLIKGIKEVIGRLCELFVARARDTARR